MNAEQTEKKFMKREPSRVLSIKDLQNAPPSRVAIAGTIVSKNDELTSFLIDDGEGTVLVITNNIERFGELKEGQFVRVLGKIWGEGDELELQSDIIQDISKIDPPTYKKVMLK